MTHKYFTTLLVSMICLGYALTVGAATYHVYPKGTAVTEKNAIAGFSDWKIQPKVGDVIFLYDDMGHFKEDLHLFGIHGTAERPIRIEAAPGNHPVIEGFIAFLNSSHLILESLTITGNNNVAAVQIRQNSQNVIVRNCIIKENLIGVWIADKAGMQNQIVGNTIYGNTIFGVVVDQVNCEAGKETIIARNRVYQNGSHAIEINANYYIIEENEVFRNGKRKIGTSGIHLYCHLATQDAGKHNIIRYNFVYENIETDGPDGNGIQLDQWCDQNVVYYNISFNNDGAGISVFDASDNRIYNNTLFGNGRGIPPPSFPAKADLWIGADSKRNRTRNNKFINNIIVANNMNTYTLYVDKLTLGSPMIVENNLFYHQKRKDFYSWKDRGGKYIEQLNNLQGFNNNFFGDPRFQASAPRTISDFKLQKTSLGVKRGRYLKQQRDILRNLLSAKESPNLGAIESVSNN